MAPVPYSTSGRLDLIYVVAGLTHKAQFPVDIEDTGGGVFAISNRRTLTPDTPLVVSNLIWNSIKAFYPTTVVTPNYVLYRRSGIAFIPVDSGATTAGPGTNPGVAEAASQLTITFRDLPNHIARHMWFETALVPPQKNGTSPTNPALQAYIDSVDSVGTPPFIGDNVMSRGDNAIKRNTGWVVSLNRRIRRNRSFA